MCNPHIPSVATFNQFLAICIPFRVYGDTDHVLANAVPLI